MTLQPGHKLAYYEILEPIGKGGMGEVYRAKDSKLGRDVAIKVLPDEFAQDEERLRRFRREAKVLASLNHPNIASIYGLEQSGQTRYLVLELVPGETLASGSHEDRFLLRRRSTSQPRLPRHSRRRTNRASFTET